MKLFFFHSNCLAQQGGVLHACNPDPPWEVNTEGSSIHDHPILQDKMETNLGYVRPYLKRPNIRKKCLACKELIPQTVGGLQSFSSI